MDTTPLTLPEQSEVLARKTRIADECFASEKPPHVYHYTGITGLHGILSSRELWATDVAYLNDASEQGYANGIVDRVAAAVERKVPEFEPLGGLLRLVTVTNFSRTVYASCFCEAGDLLSQWRAYSRQGAGYAIEFAFDQLTGLLSVWDTWTTIRKVVYEATRQHRIVLHIAEEIVRAVGSAPPNLDTAELQEQLSKGVRPQWALHITSAALALLEAKPFLKSAAFSEEREWRIATIQDPAGEGFDARNNMLVPYRRFPLEKLGKVPITRILIGPGHQRPKEAKASLERFLRDQGLGYITVAASPIPVSL
jgi:hypothetical protein